MSTEQQRIAAYMRGWNDAQGGRSAASININYRAGYADAKGARNARKTP